MSSPRLTIRLVLLCLMLAVPCLKADFGLEFSTSENFTENLLLDSSDISDSYSLSSAAVHFYPLSRVQLNLTSDYTYYGQVTGLGNILSGGEIILIPLNEKSPLLLYLSGKINNRSYREEFSVYNTNEVAATSSLACRPVPRIQLRAGFNYKSTTYTNSDEADKQFYEIFTGGNITIFGSNSLDIEAGYSFAQIRAIDTSTIYSYPQVLEDEDADLKKFYISPRFSRPLGKKLGFSITYTYSEFTDYQSPLVYSYSQGLLSPWASVWAGSSLVLNVKSYLIPKTVMTAGYGSWSKNFLNTLEGMDRIRVRKDDVNRYFLNISWPMPSASGIFLEPSLRIDFTDAVSTHKLYKYRSLATTVSLMIRL